MFSIHFYSKKSQNHETTTKLCQTNDQRAQSSFQCIFQVNLISPLIRSVITCAIHHQRVATLALPYPHWCTTRVTAHTTYYHRNHSVTLRLIPATKTIKNDRANLEIEKVFPLADLVYIVWNASDLESMIDRATAEIRESKLNCRQASSVPALRTMRRPD